MLERIAEEVMEVFTVILVTSVTWILRTVFLHERPFSMDGEPNHKGEDRPSPNRPPEAPPWHHHSIRFGIGKVLEWVLFGVVWHSIHIAQEWALCLPLRMLDAAILRAARQPLFIALVLVLWS